MDRRHGRRQRHHRRLAERVGSLARALLLAHARAKRGRRHIAARDHLLAVRLCAAGFTRFDLARGDDRHRAAARAMDGFRNRRRFRGAGGGALRLSQGQRVSGQHLDFAVDRRARYGPARRRRNGVGRRRGRSDLPVAVDLGDQPHRLFQARARRPHHPAGCAVPQGLVGAFEAWRSARAPVRLLGENL